MYKRQEYNGWVLNSGADWAKPDDPTTAAPDSDIELVVWQDSFEREVPTFKTDYGVAGAFQTGRDFLNFRYTCVWRNDAPPLVRVITDGVDVRSRLADLRPAETVYRLPQAK